MNCMSLLSVEPFGVNGLQVRAGTGGGEASLWAADLVRMYQRYAETQGWKVSFLNASEGESGGYKEAVLQVYHQNNLCLVPPHSSSASLPLHLQGTCLSTAVDLYDGTIVSFGTFLSVGEG